MSLHVNNKKSGIILSQAYIKPCTGNKILKKKKNELIEVEKLLVSKRKELRALEAEIKKLRENNNLEQGKVRYFVFLKFGYNQ